MDTRPVVHIIYKRKASIHTHERLPDGSRGKVLCQTGCASTPSRPQWKVETDVLRYLHTRFDDWRVEYAE